MHCWYCMQTHLASVEIVFVKKPHNVKVLHSLSWPFCLCGFAEYCLWTQQHFTSFYQSKYCISMFTTPCLNKKNKQNYFYYNYVKLSPNLISFGRKMTNSLKLYEVHSFSNSPNSRQCTTVLNADVPNRYITL